MLIKSFFFFFSFHVFSQVTIIENARQLSEALARGEPMLEIKAGSQIDLSSSATLVVTQPLILKGNNALLFSRGKQKVLLDIKANDVQIHNIRLQGSEKDTKKSLIDDYNKNHRSTRGVYQFPITQGIIVHGDNFILKNSELQGFSHAALVINHCFNAQIINNYIHHNQRQGLGYGVMLIGHANAQISRNYFDFNRHSVAGTGHSGQSYRVYHNTFGINHLASTLDMHGGVDRKDKTNVAGYSIVIESNTILCAQTPAFVFRGVPEAQFVFKNNKLKHASMLKALTVSRSNPDFLELEYRLLKTFMGTVPFSKQFEIRGNSMF